MSRLTTWIGNQNPKVAKSMTPIKDVDFLHISTNGNLRNMVPRIGHRQLKDEDRTIPRICGCENIKGCILGHSAVYHMITNGESFDGSTWHDGEVPVFHIYRANVDEFVRPTKKLVPDVTVTKEIWVVPFAPETCNLKPEKVGMLLPIRTEEVTEMGSKRIVNSFYLYCRVALQLDDSYLEAGYYSFSMDGDLTPYPYPGKPYNVQSISNGEWKARYSELQRVIKERKQKA
ncbi:hypothetical protein pVa21_172 [Vibrio phage pVa-21]|nr:hypothetical protein pVa21_172 [Vibrio phage pVa-21]